jgi:hypothetical protein
MRALVVPCLENPTSALCCLIYRPGDCLRARDKSEVSRLLGYNTVSIGKLLRFGRASCLHPNGLSSTLGLIISSLFAERNTSHEKKIRELC